MNLGFVIIHTQDRTPRDTQGHHVNFESIITALESDATVLTGNNRLARRIKRRFDEKQQAGGVRVWPSARVLPLESWLHRLFEDYQAIDGTLPVLIDSTQQQYLWEQIIDESKQQRMVFLNVAATARQIQQAWVVANAYDYDFSNETEPRSPDQQQFVLWVNQYQQRCQLNGFTDDATLMEVLARSIAENSRMLEKRILLTGFYELTPQQQRFVDKLRESGVDVELVDSVPDIVPNPVRVSPLNDSSELQMAARWARNQLESDPSANLAIVVPDIQNRKTILDHSFNECFFPGLSPAQLQNQEDVWNISLGAPLVLMPVVESAMLVLELLASGLSSEELTRLLLSPHLHGGDSELSRRAILDARDNVRKYEHVSLTTLIALTDGQTGGLHRALDKVKTKIDYKVKSPSDWAKNFAEILESIGWPGERALRSSEFQQVEQFRNVVSALSVFDGLAKNITFGAALTELKKMLHQTVFKSKSAEAPIQVLGLLEVSGLVFDAMWVCSMDNQQWPQTSSPNPYLPLTWQKKVEAPHASVKREYAYASYVLSQLKHSAPTVIFSHVVSRDENVLQCANMIADLPLQEMPELICAPKTMQTPLLESLQDDFGAAVLEGEHIRGGSALFSDQAACPFRAFVKHRMTTRELERAKPGVDARDRGNLVHQLLEAFWRETKDHQSLQALTDAGLDKKISELAVNRLSIINGGTGLVRLNDLETDRAIKIVRKWLDLEKQREPFRVVSLEETEEIQFEGIDIKLQIDRIDAITIGSEDVNAIFDYKTSASLNHKSWIDDRPSEPQLPIYALSRDTFPDAVCYVQLTGTEQRFQGYAISDDFLPGVGQPKTGRKKTDVLNWDETYHRWKNNLKALADEIKTGCATVTPKKGVCEYCKLKPVCRIDDVAGEEE